MLKIYKVIIIFLVGSTLVGFILFEPVPTKHYSQCDYYNETLTNIENTSLQTLRDSSLRAGYAREHIMFYESLPLAGYGFRGLYESIHDSLKISTLYLKNNYQKVIILSLDLLVFPPEIVSRLRQELPKMGENMDDVFFSATHTHTGIGGWAKPPLGWLFGNYRSEVVEFITQKILKSILEARLNVASVEVGFQKISVPEHVSNRLTKNNPTDNFIRAIHFKKKNGKSILWTTYAAHPTCIHAKKKIVSRDYPGFLVDYLEKDPNIEFALFSAGAVGSHAPKSSKNLRNFHKSKEIGLNMGRKIRKSKILFEKPTYLKFTKAKLNVGNLSPRISESWRVRSFIFSLFVPKQDLNLNLLQIGNQLICGIPADFSGELMSELDDIARRRNINLMITSFNGAYIGYVVPQKRLKIGRDETREMNWVGNYAGEYFVDIISYILLKKN